MTTKCTICHEQDAVYAVQYVADDRPTAYTLGSHIRGFEIVAKVCSSCWEKNRRHHPDCQCNRCTYDTAYVPHPSEY